VGVDFGGTGRGRLPAYSNGGTICQLARFEGEPERVVDLGWRWRCPAFGRPVAEQLAFETARCADLGVEPYGMDRVPHQATKALKVLHPYAIRRVIDVSAGSHDLR